MYKVMSAFAPFETVSNDVSNMENTIIFFILFCDDFQPPPIFIKKHSSLKKIIKQRAYQSIYMIIINCNRKVFRKIQYS